MPTWLAIVVALIAVLSGLGASAAFLSAGRQKGRITALREDVIDRDKRITFLEGEDTRKTAKIDDLQAQLDALGRVITGEAHFAALHDQIEAHFAEVLPALALLKATQKDILAMHGDQRTGENA